MLHTFIVLLAMTQQFGISFSLYVVRSACLQESPLQLAPIVPSGWPVVIGLGYTRKTPVLPRMGYVLKHRHRQNDLGSDTLFTCIDETCTRRTDKLLVTMPSERPTCMHVHMQIWTHHSLVFETMLYRLQQ